MWRIALFLQLSFSVSITLAEDFRKVLVSAEENVRVEQWRITHADLELETDPWSIEKRTLHGGKQEGVEIVTVDSGKLRFSVIPTRGMSILEVRAGQVRLGWNSPVKEVVHPRLINLQSRGGLGWLDGFNEWMVRCGLEFAGHPGPDTFITNTGDEATMDLTLHGKIGNIPASEVEVIVDEKPPHRIRVRGIVHERMFFGPKLELIAEVSVAPGEESFRINDTITNHGSFAQEFQIIYHANYGRPLLEDGARVVTAAKQVEPMNDHAGQSVNQFSSYRGPTKGFIEEVYLIDPYSDPSGKTSAMLQNAEGDLGTSITWSVSELPYLTIWKNTAAESDGYVTGLEPATGFPFNRGVERKLGRLPKIPPGASRHFQLDFAIHRGQQAVSQMRKQIADIVAGRELTLRKESRRLDH